MKGQRRLLCVRRLRFIRPRGPHTLPLHRHLLTLAASARSAKPSFTSTHTAAIAACTSIAAITTIAAVTTSTTGLVQHRERIDVVDLGSRWHICCREPVKRVLRRLHGP